MKYLVTKRFKTKAICGEVNLAYGTECFSQGNVIYRQDKQPLCLITSENAHMYFTVNDDGLAKERRQLIEDIAKLLSDKKMEKRWDFVVKTDSCIYLIETNFYGSGGSKLNETARSYKTIATEMKHVKGAKFVWFTDGAGWKSAARNLEETFDVLDDIYSINDMQNGIMTEVFK